MLDDEEEEDADEDHYEDLDEDRDTPFLGCRFWDRALLGHCCCGAGFVHFTETIEQVGIRHFSIKFNCINYSPQKKNFDTKSSEVQVI